MRRVIARVKLGLIIEELRSRIREAFKFTREFCWV